MASQVAVRDLRVGDVRSPWLIRSLIVLSVLVCTAVLYLTRYRDFFYDEWTWVATRRSWDFNAFALSHAGHWSTIPILVWKILFITIGIRSHVPYEAALLVVHMAAVLLLFAIIRRRSGDLAAFAAALTLLVLGSGGDDIVWAFQLAWVGSVAFGLLAMLLLDGMPSRSRAVTASLALLGSLMCSSVGVVFVVAVGAELLVDTSRRRFLGVMALPVVAFVGWFLAFDTGRVPGAPGIKGSFLEGSLGLAYLWSLVQFVVAGLQATASGILGIGQAHPVAPTEQRWPGLIPLALVGAAIAWRWSRQERVASWQVGLLAGVLVWFPLISLGRVQFGVDQATSSRYIYVAAVLVLPLIADAAAQLPWRSLWRPALSFAYLLILVGNVAQLADMSLSLREFMGYENAELQTVEVFRGAPDMAGDRFIDDFLEPRLLAQDYLAATSQLGSPVSPANVDSLRQLPWFAVDRVMLNLFGDALSVRPDASRTTQGLECRIVDSSAFSTLNLQVANGQPLMVQSTNDTTAALYLSFLEPPPSQPLKHVQLAAATPEWVHLPDSGKPIIWQLRIQTGPAGMLRVCSAPGGQIGQPGTYRAAGVTFTLGQGWTPVGDAAATGGKALKAVAGTPGPEGAYSDTFVPMSGAYDIWYRVRVSSTASDRAEMILTLTDATANRYVAARSLKPSEASLSYRWMLVASNVTPPRDDLMRFQTNIAAKLSTDWYLDASVMVPTGTPLPGP